MTMDLPTRGQMLLATEGLALARQAFSGDASARQDRVAEIRQLLRDYDTAGLGAPVASSDHDIHEGYALWSETYDRPLRLFPIEEPVVRDVMARWPSGRVLDAACGTGRHAAWLRARGHAVIGVDQSPEMLAKARIKLPDCRFESGDLEKLPIPDASVDNAVCALALVHLAQLPRALAELARVVRPGGRVVVSDVHPFLVTLGWQAQFVTASGETGLMRLNVHLASAYAAAISSAGLRIEALHEPLLSEYSAATVARDVLPEANAAAWVGLPGVIIWDLVKP